MEEYLESIKKASQEIYIWFKNRIAFGKQSEDWWQEVMDSGGALSRTFRDTPARNYAVQYLLACLNEMEFLEKGAKNEDRFIEYIGEMSISNLTDFLPKAIGNRRVRLSKESNKLVIKML